MSKRSDLRAHYIEGWETMDALKLVSSVTDDFVFDDPAEPRPITKAELVDYMPIWPAKAKALGTAFEFDIVDKVVQDRQGVLLEWYWWRLVGTDVEGAAVIKQPMQVLSLSGCRTTGLRGDCVFDILQCSRTAGRPARTVPIVKRP